MKKGCFCSRNTASCTAALVFSIDQEIIYAKYLRSKGITKTLIKDVKKNICIMDDIIKAEQCFLNSF